LELSALLQEGSMSLRCFVLRVLGLQPLRFQDLEFAGSLQAAWQKKTKRHSHALISAPPFFYKNGCRF
jgi:hypothetical protein